jgi:hypothetical protein
MFFPCIDVRVAAGAASRDTSTDTSRVGGTPAEERLVYAVLVAQRLAVDTSARHLSSGSFFVVVSAASLSRYEHVQMIKEYPDTAAKCRPAERVH